MFCMIGVRDLSLDIAYFEEKSCSLDMKGGNISHVVCAALLGLPH